MSYEPDPHNEIHRLEAELTRLREDRTDLIAKLKDTHIRLLETQTQPDTLIAALRKIAAEPPRGLFIRVDAENMRAIARAAISEVEGEKT